MLFIRSLLTLCAAALFSLTVYATEIDPSDEQWLSAEEAMQAFEEAWSDIDWGDEEAWDVESWDGEANWDATDMPADDNWQGQISVEQSAININAATADELASLTGIGPVRAQSIVEYRDENGAFESVDELARVSGISDALVELNRQFLSVG